MDAEHLLLYALGAPLMAGLLLAGALHWRSGPRWPTGSALLLGVVLLAVFAWNPNFVLQAPWRSAEAALPWAALLWAVAGAAPGRYALPALLVPAGFVSWLTFTDVAVSYGWSTLVLTGWILIATVAGAGSAALARQVARQHPPPASLATTGVIALAASAVLLLGDTTKGAEYSGMLAATFLLPWLLSFRRGGGGDASAWAVPLAGALHAVLLFGLLQADALWISVAMLVVIAPAAGLITLRDERPLPRAAAVALVTALPSAAAIFLAWFKAEAAPAGGALPY
jgi:hypothetical protein